MIAQCTPDWLILSSFEAKKNAKNDQKLLIQWIAENINKKGQNQLNLSQLLSIDPACSQHPFHWDSGIQILVHHKFITSLAAIRWLIGCRWEMMRNYWEIPSHMMPQYCHNDQIRTKHVLKLSLYMSLYYLYFVLVVFQCGAHSNMDEVWALQWLYMAFHPEYKGCHFLGPGCQFLGQGCQFLGQGCQFLGHECESTGISPNLLISVWLQMIIACFVSTCLLRTPFIPQSALHLHCLDMSGLAGKNSSQWDVDWPVSAFLSTCLLRTPFIPQSALHLHCLDWLVKVLPNEMWTDRLALSSEQGIWYEHGDASHKYWAKVEKNCATVLLYAGQSYANHAMIMIYYACKGSKIWFNTYLYTFQCYMSETNLICWHIWTLQKITLK